MLRAKYLPFILKHILRHRLRSLLTVTGVGTSMFLFCTVRSMQQGVVEATMSTANETVLVVYRENRYCPFSSRLPEDYSRKIAKVPGVTSVVPMKVVVGNCRAALDVVTFRGVPPDALAASVLPDITVIDGSASAWHARSDAALIGERIATRRGLRVGDSLEMAGVTITIAGIMSSPHPQDQNTAYVHLPFLQQSSGAGLGEVTQFTIKVSDPEQLDQVAQEVDALFRESSHPTETSSEKAFAARAVMDIVELVGFASWLGWGALVAVFALVANAIVLSVQDRIRDHAILQTLGYNRFLIARLIIVESALLSLIGGATGVLIAALVLHFGQFSISVEGLSVNANATPETILQGLGLCLLLGGFAGLFPAWQASRRQISACFRAV